MLFTSIFKFTARLWWTKTFVLRNLSNWQKITWQYNKSCPILDFWWEMSNLKKNRKWWGKKLAESVEPLVRPLWRAASSEAEASPLTARPKVGNHSVRGLSECNFSHLGWYMQMCVCVRVHVCVCHGMCVRVNIYMHIDRFNIPIIYIQTYMYRQRESLRERKKG